MNRKSAVRLAKDLIQSTLRPARNIAIRRRLEAEGLLSPTSRRAFLAGVSAPRVLEIGPFDAPQLRGNGVAYFDVLDGEGLRRRARDLGRNSANVPPIDYVSPTGDLGVIHEKFDAVLSCHSIEHQPDLIRHLQGVGNLLRPGGRYFLIVPDKRFTFDYYLAETAVQDALAAYEGRRSVHTRDSVLAHFLRTTHNRSLRHWLGLHGKVADNHDTAAHAHAAGQRAADGEYVDVHAWIFSPARFQTLVTSLRDSGLVPFSGIEVHETEVLDSEFFAILTRRDDC